MKVAAVFAAAVLFTSAFAAPALANDFTPATQVVRTADLNLSSKAGADRMLMRIRHAARAVCGVDGGIASLTQYSRGRACVRETVANAVSRLNQPMVTARYIERTGDSGGTSMGTR